MAPGQTGVVGSYAQRKESNVTFLAQSILKPEHVTILNLLEERNVKEKTALNFLWV